MASKRKNDAWRLMSQLFSSSPSFLNQCCRIILGTSTFSLVFLPLLDIVFRYYRTKKLGFPLEDYTMVMKHVAKSVLDVTVRPDYTLLECCVGIFKNVSKQVFESVLLPGMLKALLRNPDELTRGECKGRLGSEVM
jgi:hypothetical protein